MVKSRVKSRGRYGGKSVRRRRRGGKSIRRRRRGGKRRTRRGGMRGGYGKGAGPIGYSYKGGDVGTWPGVYSSILGGNTNGISMGNHYPLSNVGVPTGAFVPPVSTEGLGIQTGGAPLWLTNLGLPAEVFNIPRLVGNGLSNVYNSYVGQNNTGSPLPQYQPINQSKVPIIGDIPNVPLIHLQAGQAAADI